MRLQFRHNSTGWQLLYPGRVMLPDGGQEVCPGAREGSGCEMPQAGAMRLLSRLESYTIWTSWTAWHCEGFWSLDLMDCMVEKKALSHELDEEVVKITDLLLILKHRFQKKT